jgi:hypothetical protein
MQMRMASRSGIWNLAVDNNEGKWGDAQESGYAEINPLALWTSTINAMQNRTWIPVEEFLPERAVIMGRDLSL